MAFAIDATKYAEAKVPEWSLRQVFADSKLPESLRRAVADHDILTLEVFSNLGDDMKSFKEAMCKVLTEEELGTGCKQVVHLASLTTCWKRASTQIVNQETQLVRLREDPLKIPEIPEMEYGEYRIAFMKRHPDIPLADHKEPNKRFIERMIRDFLVHRVLPPYELGEIRLRSETIVQRPGLAVSAEHLLRTAKVDEPAAVTLEDDALSRIHALMMSLEFLGHLRYGGFLYGKEQGPGEVSGGSDNRRRETPGLQWIVNVDRKFRKKVYELQTEQKDRCPTYSAALSVAMKEHSLYWAESRMEVLTGTATAPRPVTVDAPARTPTST